MSEKKSIARCLYCGAEVPGVREDEAVCGLRRPCKNCGHPYPLGDCSDA